MQNFYYDSEQNTIFSTEKMKAFYERNAKERKEAGEEELTFLEYVNNCLTCNNGCIDIIVAENFNEACNKVKRMYKAW